MSDFQPIPNVSKNLGDLGFRPDLPSINLGHQSIKRLNGAHDLSLGRCFKLI
ncbi:hypothetical protein [Planktotalea arctica]|uniref:hypothetical protein n=1 Tax=Planktotalea arctica TaxID=1481893 RepID=UPI001592B0AE|nr:hypothetical protein [Planktotalea arctica]